MVHHGLLRHMIADVYAEAKLPESAALRAAAAYTLLNTTLRRRGVLCGETAAWVHLGGAAAERITVITQGVSPRQVASAGRWQLHQIAVDPGQIEMLGPAQTTTALRTAADLFCGFGVQGCREPLDRVARDSPGSNLAQQSLQHWPAVHAPLRGRDESLTDLGPVDQLRIRRRWTAIAALCRDFHLNADQLADTVLGILSRTSWDLRRRDRVRQLLDHCISRRLPTVR